jgi:hypothetical protein
MTDKFPKQKVFNLILLLIMLAIAVAIIIALLPQLNFGGWRTFVAEYGIWIVRVALGIILWSQIKGNHLLSISIGALVNTTPTIWSTFLFSNNCQRFKK